jgi:hypothetical protein
MNKDVSRNIDPQRHVPVHFTAEIVLPWLVILKTQAVLTQSENDHTR